MTLFSLAYLKRCGEWFCKNVKAMLPNVCWIFGFFSLIFMSIALQRYWVFFESDAVIDGIFIESVERNSTENGTSCLANDVIFVKIYLIGVTGILALNLPLLLLMIYHSSRGSITDVHARRLVAPLIYLKWVSSDLVIEHSSTLIHFRIFLVLPEIAINVMGTLWIFCGFIQCLNSADSFANTIIKCE